MQKTTDIRLIAVELYFLPVETRLPLKFGTETLTSVTCARVRARVRNQGDRTAEGWGDFEANGHPLKIGHAFQKEVLPDLLEEFNQVSRAGTEELPWLAALVCCSAFDIALHDAYGAANQVPTYQTYAPPFLQADLSHYLEPAESFKGKYPQDFLVVPPSQLMAWHLVSGVDPLTASDLRGDEPDDGYPVMLADWIERDGLKCLKVKLRGNDCRWDYQHLAQVGEIAIAEGVDWLTSDFNCTVTDPEYFNTMLDQLRDEHARIYGMILYVEQPFPYDLEKHRLDVHSVSARKPLFMDESAHDWELVRLGCRLGWTGIALKICKAQTGALLSLCWAKAHGMTLMVQGLTNPMLAQILHMLLAAHAGTIMGVETNAMQFYPQTSRAEQKVHPGLHRRKKGRLGLSSIRGAGFGYRIGEIDRRLPEPAASAGNL